MFKTSSDDGRPNQTPPLLAQFIEAWWLAIELLPIRPLLRGFHDH